MVESYYYMNSRGGSLEDTVSCVQPSNTCSHSLYIVPEKGLRINGGLDNQRFYFGSVLGDDEVDNKEAFVFFLKAAFNPLEALGDGRYRINMVKLRHADGKAIKIYLGEAKLGDEVLQAAVINKGNYKHFDIKKLLLDLKFNLFNNGKRKFLKGGDIGRIEYADLEEGLTRVLNKNEPQKQFGSEYERGEDINERVSASAVYVSMRGGICFSYALSKEFSKQINNNPVPDIDENMITPFFTAISDNLNQTFKHSEIQFFELERGSNIHRMYFQDFYDFRIFAIIDAGSKIGVNKCFGEFKQEIIKKGWNKLSSISNNEREADEAREALVNIFNINA